MVAVKLSLTLFVELVAPTVSGFEAYRTPESKEFLLARFLQQPLGHASVKTAMDIYGKPSVDDIQEDYVQKMDG